MVLLWSLVYCMALGTGRRYKRDIADCCSTLKYLLLIIIQVIRDLGEMGSLTLDYEEPETLNIRVLQDLKDVHGTEAPD